MPSPACLAQGKTLVPNLGIKELLVCRRESNLPEVGSSCPFSLLATQRWGLPCASAQILVVSNGSKMAKGIARGFPPGDQGPSYLLGTQL